MSAEASTKTYLAIWGWLAALMLIGVFLCESHLSLPKWFLIVAVLSFSSVKALLVALYYMHLKMDRRLLALVAAGPLILILLAVGVVVSSRFVRL